MLNSRELHTYLHTREHITSLVETLSTWRDRRYEVCDFLLDYPPANHFILDVFDTISPEVPFGLVPQENSIFGSVTETYDSLRLPEVGESKFVRGEVVVSVQHCLLVRHGVKTEDVTRILSHEQVCNAHFRVSDAMQLLIAARIGSWSMRTLHLGALPQCSSSEDGVDGGSRTSPSGR